VATTIHIAAVAAGASTVNGRLKTCSDAWDSMRLLEMTQNPQIVDAQQLRALSGKRTASAVRRWASAQGIRVRDGKDGPWTTLQAVNKALGITADPANDDTYKPDDVI